MSLFISFEGGDGSGKSTQAAILVPRLQAAGYHVTPVHEPGTTELGEYLRAFLKRESSKKRAMSHQTELLLFAAARAELVDKIVKPALAEPGGVVIADRYADSSMAYQGGGRRLRLAQVAVVNSLATQDVMPNLTFLLDCPVNEGLSRVGAHQALSAPATKGHVHQRRDTEGTRRFEAESAKFHERVRDGYRKLSEKEPGRWCVIDALAPIDDIAESVWARVERELVQRHLTRESGRFPGFWEEGLDARPIDQAKKEPQG